MPWSTKFHDQFFGGFIDEAIFVIQMNDLANPTQAFSTPLVSLSPKGSEKVLNVTLGGSASSGGILNAPPNNTRQLNLFFDCASNGDAEVSIAISLEGPYLPLEFAVSLTWLLSLNHEPIGGFSQHDNPFVFLFIFFTTPEKKSSSSNAAVFCKDSTSARHPGLIRPT